MKDKLHQHPFPGTPGKYNLKVAPWLPKVQVRVFKNSLQQQDSWRCRFVGLVFNPDKYLSKCLWEGPLNS
ncbi:hypothetical protein [Pleionea sediminis]|uniref:hypothetical protein n=1 Tax=Pleionea sediminis TaxID=2569479 RepID=UPI001185C97D|nr:hypothetical protein [Pleionea sediminis]